MKKLLLMIFIAYSAQISAQRLLGVYGKLEVPVGQLSRFLNPGGGVELSFTNIKKRFNFNYGISYAHFTPKQDTFYFDSGTTKVHINKMNAIGLVIGANFGIIRDKRFEPYVGLDLGYTLNICRMRKETTMGNFGSGFLGTQILIGPKVGTWIKLGKSVALSVAFRYNIFIAPFGGSASLGAYTNVQSFAMSAGIHLGVHFRVGGYDLLAK